jgi:hypothetical protein
MEFTCVASVGNDWQQRNATAVCANASTIARTSGVGDCWRHRMPELSDRSEADMTEVSKITERQRLSTGDGVQRPVRFDERVRRMTKVWAFCAGANQGRRAVVRARWAAAGTDREEHPLRKAG